MTGEIVVGNEGEGKPRQPWKHGDTAESRVGGAPPTCQHLQLNNREAGSSNTWQGAGGERVGGGGVRGGRGGEGATCLIHHTTEKDPRQGSPLSA